MNHLSVGPVDTIVKSHAANRILKHKPVMSGWDGDYRFPIREEIKEAVKNHKKHIMTGWDSGYQYPVLVEEDIVVDEPEMEEDDELCDDCVNGIHYMDFGDGVRVPIKVEANKEANKEVTPKAHKPRIHYMSYGDGILIPVKAE